MSEQTHHLNVFAKLRIGLGALILGVLLAMAGPAQPAAASCGGITTVLTEGELNDAIDDFNMAAPSCVFTIQLGDNINLLASTTRIDNADANSELVIEGDGHALDGQDIAGALPLYVRRNTTVTLNNITITGGNSGVNGGGILNLGALTINNSTISDNVSAGQGGGIGNAGTLVVNNSTITGNSITGTIQFGGGIFGGTIFDGSTLYYGGTITVNNSTLTNNSSICDGAAIAVDSYTVSMTINNSTISGNTSGCRGAIHNFGSTVAINSSTIANNDGADYDGLFTLDDVLENPNRPGVTTVQNSIILQDGAEPACGTALGGTIVSAGHNLSSDSSCGFTATGDQQNTDPLLGPLADNGGPTFTHGLLTGSPAIDAGDTTLTDDQRGVTRPKGAADDIGAFERASLRFTIEGPGVQRSQVSCSAAEGLVEETFDNLSGSGVGTLSGALGDYVASGNFLTVFGQDEFGGAEVPSATSNYLELETGGGGEISAELDFAATGGPGPLGYFGFWWSAGDGNNRLEVTRADGSVETFTTQSIINSPALQGSPDGNGVGVVDGHYGNPTTNDPPNVNGKNSGEAYAFVNIYAQDEASKIASVRFITSGTGFESDNHTICTELIDTQTGTDLGGIIIKKIVVPSQGNGLSFPFTDDIETPNSFSLSDGQEKIFLNVAPGTYEVIEGAGNGAYEAQSVICVDGDENGQPSMGEVDAGTSTGTATVNLDPNETVTCTFTNSNQTLAISLGWILAEAGGDRVDFRWQTATETGTAGFNILAVTESGTDQLNDALIPSTVIDSVTPTDYTFSATTDATSFLLQEVEITGALNTHGPFMIGMESGAYSGVDATDAHQIWLPLMMR